MRGLRLWRFNLWTVTLNDDGTEVADKMDRILWTGTDGFNGFACDN